MSPGPPRLLMIGLDAAEPALVERGLADGTLPHLARLRARGSYRRLASSAACLAGSPWPTFYTGTSPASHGFYHFLQWHAERMAMVRPGPDWLPIQPFWRAFGAAGPRCLVIDAPSTYPPEPFAGVEITGWASHDHLYPAASHPADASPRCGASSVARRCPRRSMGLQPMSRLLALGGELQASVRYVTDVALGLMQQAPWDLCLVSFAAIHRAGHKLWDASGARGRLAPPTTRARSPRWRPSTAPAMRRSAGWSRPPARPPRCWSSRSTAWARTPAGPSCCRRCSGLCSRGRAPAAAAPHPTLQRLRRLLPVEVRHAVKSRLPQARSGPPDPLLAHPAGRAGAAARLLRAGRPAGLRAPQPAAARASGAGRAGRRARGAADPDRGRASAPFATPIAAPR